MLNVRKNVFVQLYLKLAVRFLSAICLSSFLDLWTSGLNDKNSRNHKTSSYHNCNVQASIKWRKKIVQRVLRDRCQWRNLGVHDDDGYNYENKSFNVPEKFEFLRDWKNIFEKKLGTVKADFKLHALKNVDCRGICNFSSLLDQLLCSSQLKKRKAKCLLRVFEYESILLNIYIKNRQASTTI